VVEQDVSNKPNTMKKYPPIIAGILLGLLFIASAAMVLFNLVKMPPPPPTDTPAGMFFGAFGPTGYFTFVKLFELVGGLFVMIPRLRNFGLLLLGPVIVNILAFHLFLGGGMKDLASPMMLVMIVLSLHLLWDGRKKFAGLLN
jgi:putative oxidoreductase